LTRTWLLAHFKFLLFHFSTKIYDFNVVNNVLPTGHGWSLQEKVAEFDPGQSSPPLEGAGLLQSLVWDWFPPPQVTEQVDKALQSLQLPSEM
jgi:hypothetical protein